MNALRHSLFAFRRRVKAQYPDQGTVKARQQQQVLRFAQDDKFIERALANGE
jgi:hypothetical protein